MQVVLDNDYYNLSWDPTLLKDKSVPFNRSDIIVTDGNRTRSLLFHSCCLLRESSLMLNQSLTNLSLQPRLLSQIYKVVTLHICYIVRKFLHDEVHLPHKEANNP
jgi:hypothetical protein